jgi:hypothetical protein
MVAQPRTDVLGHERQVFEKHQHAQYDDANDFGHD